MAQMYYYEFYHAVICYLLVAGTLYQSDVVKMVTDDERGHGGEVSSGIASHLLIVATV